MKSIIYTALFYTVVIAAPAFADARLVEDKQCLHCHDVSLEKAGPSFQKIAARWRGHKEAEASLITTIRKGSEAGGELHWSSNVKMPNDAERPQITESEARKIYMWIMSQ